MSVQSNTDTLYIVGRHVDTTERGVVWEFQGVFQSILLAEDACADENYFVGPTKLNEKLPKESQIWPGAYYPAEKTEGDECPVCGGNPVDGHKSDCSQALEK